jgi:hypothetical protein
MAKRKKLAPDPRIDALRAQPAYQSEVAWWKGAQLKRLALRQMIVERYPALVFGFHGSAVVASRGIRTASMNPRGTRREVTRGPEIAKVRGLDAEQLLDQPVGVLALAPSGLDDRTIRRALLEDVQADLARVQSQIDAKIFDPGLRTEAARLYAAKEARLAEAARKRYLELYLPRELRQAAACGADEELVVRLLQEAQVAQVMSS